MPMDGSLRPPSIGYTKSARGREAFSSARGIYTSVYYAPTGEVCCTGCTKAAEDMVVRERPCRLLWRMLSGLMKDCMVIKMM